MAVKRNCPVCGKQNEVTTVHGKGMRNCIGCKNLQYTNDGEIIGVRDYKTQKMLWGNYT